MAERKKKMKFSDSELQVPTDEALSWRPDDTQACAPYGGLYCAKMDEADKYKQRLEAIAEKRRLQEEQDRVRREMEEEKLRLQQLKRKSLRDQWLMEGAPLSPTSPVSQSPRSLLWGAKAQEIEKHTDKLQAEHEQLAEEEEKMKEQMENGQTEVVNVEEVGAEQDDDAIVPNGGSNAGETEAPEDKLKTNLSPLEDETAAVLTNGGGEVEVSEECTRSSPSSLVLSPEDINTKLEDRLNVAVEEEDHAPISNASMCEEEEEEGTLVMRAERVIITDEGYDVNEDLVFQEDRLNALESEETPTPNPEEDQEETAEEGVKPETALEIFIQGEDTETTEPTAEEQPATAEEELQSCIDTNTDGQNKTLDPTSVQMQPLSTALEDAAVSPLPIYGESTLTIELMPEGEAEVSPEGPPETALKDQDPITVPGHFQEVPLADPQEKQSAEARPEEEEPLMSQTAAPNVHSAAGAAAEVSSSTETKSPTRAGQAEETQDPKRKTCQCCSVM